MFHLFKFSLLRQYYTCHHERCPVVNEIMIQATKLKPVGLSNSELKKQFCKMTMEKTYRTLIIHY